ncbi:MAG: glycoside hydrolase [Actinomycetota bacterium]|nr:glycoside hydrolase [Actinomycetota bacterium]
MGRSLPKQILVVAVLAALAAPSSSITRSAIGHTQTHAHVGAITTSDLATAVASARTQYASRDVSGRLGAGDVVTYRAGDERAEEDGQGKARVFHTGSLGIEPTLGIDSDGTLFAQGIMRGLTPNASIVLRSTDRGRSWKDVSPRLASGDEWAHSWTQDPYLTVDVDTGRVFTSDLLFPAPGQMFSYSDDRGRSWKTSVVSVEQTDHQTVFAGPPSAADTTVGYDNVVYNCAANAYATAVGSAATTCIKSLDGGATWRLTGTPPYLNDPRAGTGTEGVPGTCSGLTGHGFVDRRGTVYLPRGWCEQPWLAISEDGGLTWERVQIAENGVAASDSGPPDNIPQPSHEAAVVADRKGNLYYTWIAADLLPYLAVSTDGGQTWSEPIRVSPPGVTQTSLPAIAIAPHAPVGKIAIGYMGSTNAPGPPYRIDEASYEGATWNAYLTVSVNALTRNPRFSTSTINDPKHPLVIGKCGTLRCGAQYEFIDVQIGPEGTPWMAVIDGCCATVGHLIIGRIDGIRLR